MLEHILEAASRDVFGGFLCAGIKGTEVTLATVNPSAFHAEQVLVEEAALRIYHEVEESGTFFLIQHGPVRVVVA